MSLLDRARELEDISDAQLAQLVQQGSEAGDTWLAATETQRRKDMRDRYAAQQAKQQAANPPDIMTQRMGELGGGIPSADPNMGAPPDPSLQTGIAGPPPMMASGGAIRGYQNGGPTGGPPPLDTPEAVDAYDKLRRQVATAQSTQASAGVTPALSVDEETNKLWEEQGMGARVGFGWGKDAPTTTADVAIAESAAASELEEIERMTGRLMELNPDMDPTEAARRAGADVDSDAITYDPNTGRAMRDGEFYNPQDDHDYGNMAQLLAMRAAAEEAGDKAEYDKIQVGIDSLNASMARSTGDEEILGFEDYVGLGDPAGGGALSRLRDVRDKYSDEMRGTTDADRAAARLRISAADEAQNRARGIHTLRGEREAEQERILAHRLGLSEDAVRELMREMDTPEEVENRRKSAGFGALSSMFLNPDLAAGIGGMGKQITGMDDMLREERKSALEKIRAEREGAGLLEQQGRTDIFGTKLRGQQDLDTAELARLDLDYDVAKGVADKERAGAGTIAEMGMEIEGMAYEGEQALAAARRASAAAFQEALNDRESFMIDPKNWEPIMNRHADIIAEIEGNRTLSESDRKQALQTLHEEAIRRIRAIGASGADEINRIMAMSRRPTATS